MADSPKRRSRHAFCFPTRLAASLRILALVALVAPGAVNAKGLQPQCQAYLDGKGLASPKALEASLAGQQFGGKCIPRPDTDAKYAPESKPKIAGATDTSDLGCHHGNPVMYRDATCCGVKPHFNWVVSTCEPNSVLSTSMFCKVPQCVVDGSPKINYVAAYQFNGSHFVLLEDSTAGDISSESVSGDYHKGTGFQKVKHNFDWTRGAGDWTSKYAPWGNGPRGPRGVTPPGALYILSAENFYYAGFYLLSQLNLNVQGMGNPTGSPCWLWEFDPVEGTVGWTGGGPLPGELNQLYSTNNAAPSGCMPVTYTAQQANALKRNFSTPVGFQEYCKGNPKAMGCEPWERGQENLWWSGGVMGTQRFENYWDEAYLFAVVIDKRGVWIYRWRPDPVTGETGWPGVTRHEAQRVLPPHPRPVAEMQGLATDVPGHVKEAVILQPSMPPEAACSAASIQAVNWQFGSEALGAMAYQLNEYSPGALLEGAQNWWAHFADTGQHNPQYPLSVAGLPLSRAASTYTCNTPGAFTCGCRRSQANQMSDATLRDFEGGIQVKSELPADTKAAGANGFEAKDDGSMSRGAGHADGVGSFRGTSSPTPFVGRAGIVVLLAAATGGFLVAGIAVLAMRRWSYQSL